MFRDTDEKFDRLKDTSFLPAWRFYFMKNILFLSKEDSVIAFAFRKGHRKNILRIQVQISASMIFREILRSFKEVLLDR